MPRLSEMPRYARRRPAVLPDLLIRLDDARLTGSRSSTGGYLCHTFRSIGAC